MEAMSVIDLSTPSIFTMPCEVPPEPPLRITTVMYLAMFDAGILTKEDNVELLEGWIIKKITDEPAPSFDAEDVPPDMPDVPPYRLTVARYLTMFACGILTEEDKVELLEGWIYKKMTKHVPHSFATQELLFLLASIIPEIVFLQCQEPVSTLYSLPEPDISVVRGNRRERLKAGKQPALEDVPLIIEIADSSLSTDRRLKKRIYARAAVPVYWIVNVNDGQVEVHTDPTGAATKPTYGQCRIYNQGDRIEVVIDGVVVGEIDTNDIFL